MIDGIMGEWLIWIRYSKTSELWAQEAKTKDFAHQPRFKFTPTSRAHNAESENGRNIVCVTNDLVLIE